MKNQCNFATNSREKYPAKKAREKHMLEAEESCQAVNFLNISQVRSSRKILTKCSAQRILSVTFLPFTHTIYSLITHKSMKGHLERKTLDRFSTTHTPIFQRKSYLSLVRNHYTFISFPLLLSYLERRFVPKHNPHLFRVQRVFWSLGSFGDMPNEADKAWRMQSGVLRDLESQRRHDSENSVGSRSLEGSSTLGRLGLEGLLLFVYSNFILQ